MSANMVDTNGNATNSKVTFAADSEPRVKPNVIKYQKPYKPHKKAKPSEKNEQNGIKTKKDSISKFAVQTYVPDTNLPLACLVSLCFNMPLGIIAMYLSLTAARAYRDGDVRKGAFRAKSSVFLSLFCIVTTVIAVTTIVLWIAIQNAQSQVDFRYGNLWKDQT